MQVMNLPSFPGLTELLCGFTSSSDSRPTSFVSSHETNLESEEDNSGSDDTTNPLVRLETIRLLIALTARKGQKIHHLHVKTAFQNGNRKKLDSTLKEMGFLQCVHEKAVYRKVSNGEFIIIAVYGDDIFMTGTSLDLINKFKKRMASQFEMLDLGELTYYLGIEVSQGKECVEIKQERYAIKILKEAGMEDCNPTLCPMEPGLKLSKAKMNQKLKLPNIEKCITLFGINYKRGNDVRLMGYSGHNVDVDDGHSTTGHVLYLGTSPITWCSKKQTTMVSSSCEAKFMAATAAACQEIWLREVLTEVMENEQVIIKHVSGENQRADPLTKALARIRFKEMRSLLGVQELPSSTQKFRGDCWRIPNCLDETKKANLQHMEALSTTEAGYMTFTEAWKKKILLKGLLTESRYEIRLVAGIATGALVKGGSWSEVPAQIEVAAYRERYSRSKSNMQILFQVDFDQGFEGLRLSSFARVLGFIKGAQGDREAEVFQVSNGDTAVVRRRLEDKQLEEKTNTDCLIKEQEKVYLGIKVGENITVTGVPGQEGAEGNVAEKKKVKESIKANLKKLLKYKAWLTRRSPVRADKNEFLEIVDKEWNLQSEKVKKNELKAVQVKVDKEPHNADLKKDEAMILKDFNDAVHDEENFLFQQAKVSWLSDGDRNSRYFHTVIKGRQNRSRIDMVYNESGDCFKGNQVAEQFVIHFQKFLGQEVVVQSLNPDVIKSPKRISTGDADHMTRSVTDAEIKNAMFDICDNKAPGRPDGYTVKFYKKAWNKVGRDVCDAIREFFANGKMLGEMNLTLITLVPKIRRQITDNILLTQELLKGYDRKNGAKRVAMKVYIQKAYDTVNWSFLENVDTSRGRGLRQGDPMSPYIFTMVMEVLTLILQKQIEDSKKFKYHWGWLNPNIGKSTVLFGNVLENIKQQILHILPFKVGKLPVTYLGVPLITKKIGINDCKCLIDIIKARVNSWKNKLVSYAGRLQLIASVLASMHIYWASAFRLPKAVIKDIDKVLKGYLWCNGEISKGKAKVSWKNVCKPKNEGGLGIKNLGDWNDALLSKHLWNVISNKDSLWVEWINAMRLKGKCIWTIKHDSNASCGWNQMLDLRDKMRKHVKYKIRDGKSIFLWHDKWWGDSSLCDLIPNEVLQRYNMNNVKVRDMVRNGKWQWPAEWKRTYPALKSIPVPNFEEGCKDRVVWKKVMRSNLKFSVNKTWMDWRIKEETVPWRKVVWFSHYTPKHSFIFWLAILSRLSTQDKLLKWYPGKQMACSLCGTCHDSIGHLFFECPYSSKIWKIMKERMNQQNMPDKWDLIIKRMEELPCNRNIMSILRRVVISACIYYIWSERNRRLFSYEKRSYSNLTDEITNNVRLKLTTLTVKDSRQIKDVNIA
nr:hypothetical protein [Tanacetum cinerariifolium]